MAHRWSFVRLGGFDQAEITTGEDLAAIPSLDQKLWVALACPTKGVEFDERTLALIDSDKDGRIRAPELIESVKWACSVMKDAEDLVQGKDTLQLDAIDDSTEEGKLLLQTTRTLLKSLGKPDAKAITVEEASKALEAFSKERFNGDGILPAASTDDAASKKAIEDVLSCSTPEKDRSGADGISAKSLEELLKELDAHVAWLDEGQSPPRRPLEDDTDGAFAALSAVRAKIDDYFARVKVAAYDPRALAAVNGEEKQYLELAAKDLNVTAAEVEKLPLAIVAGEKPLPLGRGVNPAWADRIAAFRAKVVTPVLKDKEVLTEVEWKTITSLFAEHATWAAAVKGAKVQKLGAARARELAAPEVRKKLQELIAEDAAKEPQAKAIEKVEKLVRLNRDLLELVNNFVSFRDFYSRKAPAMFQVGTLYLDTRACELCVRVNDAGKHATMAPLANTCLIYCDLKNAKGETMQIAAAMTAGDVDNLMVGRNGVFYDRKGKDWDATVTKIIENPISVRQAFWAPYKKVLRLIEEQIARRAAADAAAADARLAAEVDAAPGTRPAVPEKKFDIGTVAAIGVAVGGITAALGALLAAFFGLGIWMPIGVVGLILCISGPSMAVAWLKLRRRNLGPILDANGWAVNAQAVVNVPLGGSLTKVATLPPGSKRQLSDPFAEKRRPWFLYAIICLLISGAAGWYLGKLDGFLPVAARSVTVLGENAPAYDPNAAHEDEDGDEDAPAGAAHD